MRKGWEIKKLADICEFFNDGNWIESKDQSESGYRLIQTGNIGIGEFRNKSGKERYISEETFKRLRCTEIFEGDILISRLPDPVGRTCTIPALDQKMITAVDCTIVRLKENILLADFFKYYSQSQLYFKNISEKITGTTRDRISRSNLGGIKITVPPLSEQKEIISILDEIFAAINQAKKNLQRNLQNAKKLFQSELNSIFGNKGQDWTEKKFSECFKLKSGDMMTAKMMNEKGEYSVYGGNGVSGKHDSFNLSGENIIIGRVGALCGNVRFINEKIWLTDNAFQIVDFQFEFDYSFLTYLLNFKDLRSAARQTAQPVISNSSLKDMMLQFPKKQKEQKKIVSQLDTLSVETKNLENIYQQKLNNLEELKKSILQKAFSGELCSPERACPDTSGALSANDGCSPSQKKKASSIKSPERA